MEESGPGATGGLEVDPQVSSLPPGRHVDGTDDVLQEPSDRQVSWQLKGLRLT